jgi:LuxR family transcriptional regulator, maltose regulon positive regulatory protein
MPQNADESPDTEVEVSEIYSRRDSLFATVGAVPFMQHAPRPPCQPSDWREAFRIIAETEKAVGVLAQELRASAQLDAFQLFIERRPHVRALLRAMHGVLSLHTIDGGAFHPTAPQSSRAARVRGAALSPRERAVLRLIGAGLSTKRIARELQIAPETVKSHTRSMLAKFNAKTRAEAVALASSMNVI